VILTLRHVVKAGVKGSMNHRIRAVTFDLWNTLIEVVSYTDARVNALYEAAARAGFTGPVEAAAEAYRGSTAWYEREWRTRHVQVDSGARLDYMLGELGVELAPADRAALAEEFEDLFLRSPPPLKPGALEAVTQLSSRYRLGVISDTGITPGRAMRRYFEDRGLMGHFTSLVFSDETGLCKPHPDVFRRALGELGAEPREAVHVGDLLRTDIAGAKGAGMRAVWVRSPYQDGESDAEPDYVIDSLHELPGIIESLDR
jgi:HAD superfamily hydrolase (TIGR01509 family)